MGGARGAHVAQSLSLLPLEAEHFCKFSREGRDVQEGEKHRPDTEMFGESTTSSLDVGCLSGYESMSIVRPM